MIQFDLRRTTVCICFGIVGIFISIIIAIMVDMEWGIIPNNINLKNHWILLSLLLAYTLGHLFGRWIYNTNTIAWKFQSLGLLLFFIAINLGFRFIPADSTMIPLLPGPLVLFKAIGFPFISSLGISYFVQKKSPRKKDVNTVFFLLSSIFIWIIAFLFLYKILK